MPNAYFQFQQFRIEQHDCAMKVSTDACLLGAAADLAQAHRILDVGTGTGLLALMAAQRNPHATIEAVEINHVAAIRAAANVAASPWAGRIRVCPQSLAAYAATCPVFFDHIVCNPPFFRRSLPAPDAARATARHAGSTSLTFEELVASTDTLLTPAGRLTVLLPPPETAQFAAVAAAAGLVLVARLAVRHRPGGRVTRHISRFERGAAGPVAATEISIRTADDAAYSEAFRALLTGFYLAL